MKFRAAAVFVLVLMAREARAVIPHGTLEPVPFASVDFDKGMWERRTEVLSGLNNSLEFMASAGAEAAYRRLQSSGISHLRVQRSLSRFRDLLVRSTSRQEFERRVKEEFAIYRSTGNDGQGTVRFTGYFQPVYKASRVRTAEYRYPIYRMPHGYDRWMKPHPTRQWLEGVDGLGNPRSPIRGLELAYLRSRYEVYMIHVQGSAILELPDGKKMAVGFAGATDHAFRGVPVEVVRAAGGDVEKYFREQPQILNAAMAQNNRFVFFKENRVNWPIGCLGVPVVAERSIATDKNLLPPGGVALIRTRLPDAAGKPAWRTQLVLDLDAGKAIKGPGRVDLFMGAGPAAQKRANSVYAEGSLYYLLLK